MKRKNFARVSSSFMAAALIMTGAMTTNVFAESGESSVDVSNAEYTIKLAMTQGDVSRDESGEVTWAERFEEEVEKNSNGRIDVVIYPSGQLGSADESVTGLLNNSLEMTCVNINSLNNVYSNSMVLSTPAIVKDEEQCNTVLSGDWGNTFFENMAEESGIHVLSAFCNGMRDFTTSNKELTTVDTAKGVTFRVMQSEVCEKMVEALGANPVPMAGSEMYTAMQNGTVDGQENPPVNILNDKTYEVQKYMVLDKHIASVVTFDISESFWKSLPEDLQKAVQDAADTVTPEAEKVIERLNTEGIETLKDYGMSIYNPTEEELQAWHDKMKDPCVEFVRGEIGDEIVDNLLAAIEATE